MKRANPIMALMLFIIFAGCGGSRKMADIDQTLTEDPVEEIVREPVEKNALPPGRDFDRNMVDMMTAGVVDEEKKAQLNFETVFFGLDESSLSSKTREILGRHAGLLQANPEISLMIEGHCDERGTIEYNLALGERRAFAVKTYLKNYGIDPARLYTISYGKERPLDRGHNEAALAKNRRAAFQIIGK